MVARQTTSVSLVRRRLLLLKAIPGYAREVFLEIFSQPCYQGS